MANFKESADLAYEAFRELASHVLKLATTLQSLDPSNKTGSSLSAQYLYDEATMLKASSEKLKALMSSRLHRSSDQAEAG